MVSTGLLLRLMHCKLTKMKQLASLPNRNIETHPRVRKIAMKSKNLDLGKICRVCLSPGDIPIFGSESHRNISKELQEFGGIEVQSSDTFPQHICSSCYDLLQSAISLRKTAQEADSYLRLSERKKRVKKSKKHDSVSKIKKKKSKVSAKSSRIDRKRKKVSEPASDADNDDFNVNDLLEQIDFTPVYSKTETKLENESKSNAAPTEYNCERCEITFETQEQYQQHLLSDEHDKKKTKCPICQQEFSFLYIKKHMKSHDADSQEKHICDVCGRIVRTRTYLIRHRATHNLDLPFKCPQCPYRGRFRENIKVHMRSHSGVKPFKCPHCPDRAFINSSNLNRHLLTHNKGNQDYRFKCDICEKGFHEKRRLRDHLKIEHAGIRDHVCDICGKAFGLRNQMMKHQIKVHKREPLYPSGRRPLYLIAQQIEEQKKAELLKGDMPTLVQ